MDSNDPRRAAQSLLPAPTPELIAHFNERLQHLHACLGCSRRFGVSLRPAILAEFYPRDFRPYRALYALCSRCKKQAQRKSKRGLEFRKQIEAPILAELAAYAAAMPTVGCVQ